MKIAITADNHLTTQARNPERFQTLVDIYKQCDDLNVKLLIIAGDLFDQSMPNYAEFESIYKKYRSPDLTTAVIPGNHDQDIRSESFSLEGLIVHNQPALLPLNNSWRILFAPYQDGQSMGSVIAPFTEELKGQRWILIGHGDWTPGVQLPDAYEPGVYMPLTRSDLTLYKPELVFLGHIHSAFNGTKVHYPGSPCPINRSEVGLRRFLLLDLKQGKISSQILDSPLLHFNESFVMVSRENELDLLNEQMQIQIKTWNLPKGWEKRAHIRIKVSGIASDRSSVKEVIHQAFPSDLYAFVGEPDLNDLYHLPDPDREQIALKIQDWLNDLDWIETSTLPGKSEILQEALKIIYGV